MPLYELATRKNAPEIIDLLVELIHEHHDVLGSGARIAIVLVSEVTPPKRGPRTWGKARKVTAREKVFHDHEFVIEIDLEVWIALPEHGRRALLDHELTHCAYDPKKAAYYVRKHDCEEFIEIGRRYGFEWRPGLKALVEAATRTEPRTPDLPGIIPVPIEPPPGTNGTHQRTKAASVAKAG